MPPERLHRTDMLLAGLAKELSVPMTAAAQQFASGATAQGAGEEDFSMVARFLARRRG